MTGSMIVLAYVSLAIGGTILVSCAIVGLSTWLRDDC
jgi:hypothetical protein